MILFHVQVVDFDNPAIRSRAWLPACLLRRAGHRTKLVEGQVPIGLLRQAKCLVLAGGISHHALQAARQAAEAGAAIILDIASAEELGALIAPARREQFTELAALAGSITAGNEALARHIERVTGLDQVMVVPDPLDIDDHLVAAMFRHPRAATHAAVQWVDSWMRDVVARARRRWPGHAISDAACRRVAWFGASRQANSEGGVAELLLAASDLADLAQEFPLRLDIVGRSPRAARRLIRHVKIPIAFHRYTPQRARQILRKADLCLLPSGGDEWSLARSPTRARLASTLGARVIATTSQSSMLPAMRAALGGGAAQGRPDHFGGQGAQAILTAWQQAIHAAKAGAGLRTGRRIDIRDDRRMRVLFLMQQVQDIDLIVPVAEAATADPSIETRVAVLSKVAVPASRRLRTICANGGKVEFWPGPDLLRGRIERTRFAVDVAVTASEGPGFGARFARTFAAAGRAAGARVLCLQHGVDNAGLTFGEAVPASEFLSDLVLTWGGLRRLTEAASPEIREKAVPVGCPKRAFLRSDFPGFPLAERPFIAVFENLHWRRYDDVHRKRFVSDLAATAEVSPDQLFVVKPHMGGQWFMRGGAAARPLPTNVVIADPGSPQWRRFTADAFLAHAAAAITTPSTIALDAARYRVPVGLVTYGIPAENYAPLPRLEESRDWLEFVDQVRQGRYDRSKLDAFLADVALPGDAVARILSVIRMAGEQRPYGAIMAALGERPLGLAAS